MGCCSRSKGGNRRTKKTKMKNAHSPEVGRPGKRKLRRKLKWAR